MQNTKNRHRRRSSNFNKRGNTSRFKNGGSQKPRSFRSRKKHDQRKRGGGGSYVQRGPRGTRRIPTFDPTQFINTNPTEGADERFVPKHTFKSFGLDTRLVNNLSKSKIFSPTPIQDQVIPEILEGRDVVGIAETGTGKTAAFLLPLISKTLSSYKRQTLILTPTRELAIQIEVELQKLSSNLKMYSTVCVGGAGINSQIRSLKRHNHFIIGTPGRVLDLIERRKLNVSKLTTIVLDEADRMLDMGFIHDMKKILSYTPDEKETLLFSATMNKGTEEIVHDFLRNPKTISVKKRDITNMIAQDVVRHTDDNKFSLLMNLLEDPSFRRVIVFGAMKHSVEKLSKALSQQGIKAESIHGNKAHNARQRALKAFKSGNARILVATDVAARGIHVDNVTHVINYDLPASFEDYVHRIGRTGRSENRGKALTFVK